MSTDLIISNLITFGLFVIFGLVMRNLIPSYFGQKAKNLADKQDIGDITKEIESIKDVFTQKTELLKTELQLALNNQIEHRNEERRAIIEFHHFLNEWISRCYSLDVSFFKRENASDLLRKRIELGELYEKCSISKSKLDLLVRNNQILKVSDDLMVESVKLSHSVAMFFTELFYKYQSRNSYADRFIQIYKDIGQQEIATSLATEDSQIAKEINDLIDQFFDTSVDRTKPVFNILTQFNSLAKQYLIERSQI